MRNALWKKIETRMKWTPMFTTILINTSFHAHIVIHLLVFYITYNIYIHPYLGVTDYSYLVYSISMAMENTLFCILRNMEYRNNIIWEKIWTNCILVSGERSYNVTRELWRLGCSPTIIVKLRFTHLKKFEFSSLLWSFWQIFK